MTAPKTPQRRPIVLILAILLLAFAGATFIFAPDSFAIRSSGLLAILISVPLIRRSKVRSRTAPVVSGKGWVSTKPSNRPSRVVWIAGIVSLAAVGASYFCMYIDALHGGHHVWPAYVFAGAGLVCAGIWGSIFARSKS